MLESPDEYRWIPPLPHHRGEPIATTTTTTPKGRAMTYLVNGPSGPEIRCEPGETTYPTNCERHSEHHWCNTCEGYYGVPHDGGIHEGPFAHPNQFSDFRQCACRKCKDLVAEIGRRR